MIKRQNTIGYKCLEIRDIGQKRINLKIELYDSYVNKKI